MRNLNKTLLSLGLLLVAILFTMPGAAHADKAEKRMVAKTKKAMDEYDSMEFEKAKTLLLEAISISSTESPALAAAYLNLGIVYYSGLDMSDEAAESFAKAVQINRTIELGVAYSTPEMSTMLEEARAAAAAPASGVDCSIEGVVHQLVDEAEFGTAPEIRAVVGTDVGASKVLLYFRSEGELEFSKVNLSNKGTCEFVGNIPTRAVQGKFVHYYVAAVDDSGKDLAHKGSAGSPNIIEVAKSGGSIRVTDEDPLGPGKKTGGLLDDESDDPIVFVSFAIGSGGGYVQGPTEKTKSDVNCCVGAAFLHLMPEVGYFLNSQTAVSLAFRAGFSVGANVEGHATFAPAVMARVRYHLSESGEGIQVSGSLGGGVIRNVVPIEDAAAGMDTDTTAMGPLLIGGGVGYSMSIGGPLRIVGELNALAALTAGIDELGNCPGDGCVEPKNGLQVDANLALLLAF